jgi:hypothetical protein
VKLTKIFRSTIRSWAILAVGVAVAIGLPLSVSAQQVRANWSKDAPFAQYKTYEWVPSEATNHPFYRQYVGEYVNYALTKKKGLQQVTAAQNPDLYVTYHFTTRDVMDWDTYGYGFGPGWGGWGYGGWGGYSYSQTRPSIRVMGYLTLDLIDAKTRKIVWRGEAIQDDVTKSGNAEEKQIAHSIYKMVDRYPPKMKHY